MYIDEFRLCSWRANLWQKWIINAWDFFKSKKGYTPPTWLEHKLRQCAISLARESRNKLSFFCSPSAVWLHGAVTSTPAFSPPGIGEYWPLRFHENHIVEEELGSYLLQVCRPLLLLFIWFLPVILSKNVSSSFPLNHLHCNEMIFSLSDTWWLCFCRGTRWKDHVHLWNRVCTFGFVSGQCSVLSFL